MTQFLPPNLLALFAPREPMPFMPPLDKLPHEKTGPGYHGVGVFLDQFEDPKDTPPPTRVETKEERLERKRKEKEEEISMRLEGDRSTWDPTSYVNSGDAFKTLFVARINYDTSESKLRREFESYGPIKSIRMVHDVNSGKPRGYAFIEYEHERDMHSAYKYADGKKIDGRRVLVDVERARTVKGWMPRRLGGGLGSTRKGGPDVNIRHSGREDMMLSSYRDRGDDDRDRNRDRRREDRGAGAGPGVGRDMERERRRSRSRSRERRRGERDRERERGDRERVDRERPDRGDRERDRDRDRDRRRDRGDRDRDRERRHRDRDRRDRDRGKDKDRDRDRDRDRGRDRDRERSKEDRDHEDRDRDRDRERKRDRDRERERDIENGEQEQEQEQEIEPQAPDMEPVTKREILEDEEITFNHQPPSPPPEEFMSQEIPDAEMEHQ
ncbi:U1 small nuclear ribonucleoprotein 70 kDa-like [Glandiceps talaboti]